MSIINEILEEMLRSTISYKVMRVNLFGIPKFQQYKSNSFRVAIGRLENKGYITKGEDGWILNQKGRKQVEQRQNTMKIFDFHLPKNAIKNQIIMFDIPEEKKGEREWLRRHLKKANYIMIQRSVWLGPSQLPKDFLDYVKEIGIKDGMKIFKLSNSTKLQ